MEVLGELIHAFVESTTALVMLSSFNVSEVAIEFFLGEESGSVLVLGRLIVEAALRFDLAGLVLAMLDCELSLDPTTRNEFRAIVRAVLG